MNRVNPVTHIVKNYYHKGTLTRGHQKHAIPNSKMGDALVAALAAKGVVTDAPATKQVFTPEDILKSVLGRGE